MVDGFKSVSINQETYDLLATQAERNYRSIAAQIRYLVEREEASSNILQDIPAEVQK